MDLNVQMDTKAVSRYLTRVHKRHIPYAAAQAATDTGFQARNKVMDEMEKHFDRPTPWTKKGVIVKRANKKARPIRAQVIILDNRWNYLQYGIKGGRRKPNNKAIAVPVNQRRNQYGNMTRGAVAKLLSKPNVFSGVVNGVPGIYQRMGRKGNQRVKLLVYWIPVAEYTARFPYHEIVKGVVRSQYASNFDRRLATAIKKG